MDGKWKAHRGWGNRRVHGLSLGPSSELLDPFFGWEGSPWNKIDYEQKDGTLILSSLLEDLVGKQRSWTSVEFSSVWAISGKPPPQRSGKSEFPWPRERPRVGVTGTDLWLELPLGLV